MPYVHVTRTPGITLEDYERVRTEMGTDPISGQQSHYAGVTAGALHTVDVWDSKAAADRFAAERLFPAFERASVRMPDDALILAFEAGDE
jgi:hypothetical protein